MTFLVFERQTQAKPRRNDRVLLACGFAFTTGWVDVLCTCRYGAFGTMMTGNSIFLAKSVVNGHLVDLLFYSATILSYCIGVGMNRHLDLLLRERTAARWIAVPVTICCLAVDLFRFFLGPSRWYVCFVALACGCVNVVSQKVAGVVTNAVTGNLQKLTMAAWEHYFWQPLGGACLSATLTLGPWARATTPSHQERGPTRTPCCPAQAPRVRHCLCELRLPLWHRRLGRQPERARRLALELCAGGGRLRRAAVRARPRLWPRARGAAR